MNQLNIEGKNDITQMLALLHVLRGIDFIRELKMITERHEFSPLKNDPQIYTVGGENFEDYPSLLNAARKAVVHGYRVFILPNPKGFRTARFHLRAQRCLQNVRFEDHRWQEFCR